MNQPIQILGLRFFDGEVDDVVKFISNNGGVLVVPAAPALVRLQNDAIYRDAMVAADLAIPDSGLMVLIWKVLQRKKLNRISGLAYLKRLAREPGFNEKTFFVVPSERAQTKLLGWAEQENRRITPENCYVAPQYELSVQDAQLLEKVSNLRPVQIVIAIGNGPQEKLGIYLRDRLPYRPAIHCIGAALGFLTGDQVAIPDWADRFYLGWLFRLFAQPRVFVPRLFRALALPVLIIRFGASLPPLVKKAETLKH
jgi:N-acetylglucosaminyldiphosphoundecaprenol N-acetyl-beta-D-mannosaminyltransferase